MCVGAGSWPADRPSGSEAAYSVW